MSALRSCALVLAMLAAGSAGASDQARLRVSLVLVDACTIQTGARQGADPVQVTCSSAQPYRIDSDPTAAPAALDASLPTGSGAPGMRPRLTVTF